MREVGRIGPYLTQAPVRLAGDGKLLYVIGQIVPSPDQIKRKFRRSRKARKVTGAHGRAISPDEAKEKDAGEREMRPVEGSSNSTLATEQNGDDSMEEGPRDEPSSQQEENVGLREEVRITLESHDEREEQSIEEGEEEEQLGEDIEEEDSASWVNMVVDVYHVGDKLRLIRRVVIDKYQQV